MKNDAPRLRFAPSPTGALHIGGIRTALYNYLLARKWGGKFILRIEDTDQSRYVPGAEAYILEALAWCGIQPDEGPGFGGECGPYRQSERTAIYDRFIGQLLQSGHAYVAFDTTEELERYRTEAEQSARPFKYDSFTRLQLRNSLALPSDMVNRWLADGVPHTVRLKVPEDETILVQDQIRGEVLFHSQELDDKVLRKADGLPTYHLANVVDDHLMGITHVVRGEEWLPSTAHHVLLYRALGLETAMPVFAHLPLILKPGGQGKLSKRDGMQLGIPVFPLSWPGGDEKMTGFREAGFLPQAMLNFLAFLGWNPGTEQELFSFAELTKAFALEEIGKSGARFDYEKARWFNQQHIQQTDPTDLADWLEPILPDRYRPVAREYLVAFCGLMRERAATALEFLETGHYFFEPVRVFDTHQIARHWSTTLRGHVEHMLDAWSQEQPLEKERWQSILDAYLSEHQLKPGEILPVFRVGLAGTMKGPAVYDLMALWGMSRVRDKMQAAMDHFDRTLRSTA